MSTESDVIAGAIATAFEVLEESSAVRETVSGIVQGVEKSKAVKVVVGAVEALFGSGAAQDVRTRLAPLLTQDDVNTAEALADEAEAAKLAAVAAGGKS
jgi:hypothetical protein